MCFFHVFAQTTHVVAAPHGFACSGILATRLHIPSFIEIRLGVSELQGVKVWPFPLLWLVAFTTACTTVQAVMILHSAYHLASLIDLYYTCQISLKSKKLFVGGRTYARTART